MPASGTMWGHLGVIGSIWQHLGASAGIWKHLGASGEIWKHLDPNHSSSYLFIELSTNTFLLLLVHYLLPTRTFSSHKAFDHKL